MWSDRAYTISSIPEELIGSTLFQNDAYVDKSTITVEVNQNARISVALYSSRTGGLDAVLPAQGWTLQNGWVLKWDYTDFTIFYTKQVLAGQSVTFSSTTDRMTFMIFAEEGKLILFLSHQHSTA